MRENEALLHKAYTEPIAVRKGTTFGAEVVPDQLTMSWFGEGYLNGGPWQGSLQLSYPTASRPWPTAVMHAWHETVIDVTGLVAAEFVEIPTGNTAQRTELPFTNACAEALIKGPNTFGFVREFVVWSTQPLTYGDRQNLFHSTSPTMPHMWNDQLGAVPNSMVTSMIFGGRAEQYTFDPSTGFNAAFAAKTFASDFGMGDPFSCPKIYCTRLFVVIFPMCLEEEVPGAGAYLLDDFIIDLPASWEIQAVVLAKPDEIEALTAMRRSLIPPEGSS